MLFHIFSSQEERRKYGGSAFIEIQFCKLPIGAGVKELVAVSSINHWQNDSLYVYIDNTEVFLEEYGHIFTRGIYNNLESGNVDIYGINYYTPALTDSIIEKIRMEKPVDHKIVIEWLKRAKAYNGFYILGI